MIDINAGCGPWPFWPTKATDAASLETLLKAEGVERACAYPMEAWLWPDPQEANEYRLPGIADSPFFIPSAVLNPTFGNALNAYEICRKKWNVPMVRLMPCTHLYDLSHKGVEALAQKAEADGVVLGVYVRAEDVRNRNPLTVEAHEVKVADLVALAKKHPELSVVALCIARPAEVQAAGVLPDGYVSKMVAGMPEVEHRADVPDNLFVELSFWELNDSFTAALQVFRPEQLLFGTHAPIHYPRTAVTKIQLSDAPESAKRAAFSDNAGRLLNLA